MLRGGVPHEPTLGAAWAPPREGHALASSAGWGAGGAAAGTGGAAAVAVGCPDVNQAAGER